MTLVQITAPHFVAGLVAENHVVTRAAPIISYIGRLDLCEGRGVRRT